MPQEYMFIVYMHMFIVHMYMPVWLHVCVHRLPQKMVLSGGDFTPDTYNQRTGLVALLLDDEEMESRCKLTPVCGWVNIHVHGVCQALMCVCVCVCVWGRTSAPRGVRGTFQKRTGGGGTSRSEVRTVETLKVSHTLTPTPNKAWPRTIPENHDIHACLVMYSVHDNSYVAHTTIPPL